MIEGENTPDIQETDRALVEAYKHQNETLKSGKSHDLIIGNDKITCKDCNKEWPRSEETKQK